MTENDPLKLVQDLLADLRKPEESTYEKLIDCGVLIGQAIEVYKAENGMPEDEKMALLEEGLTSLGRAVEDHTYDLMLSEIYSLEERFGRRMLNKVLRAWSLSEMTKGMSDEDAKALALRLEIDSQELSDKVFGATGSFSDK